MVINRHILTRTRSPLLTLTLLYRAKACYRLASARLALDMFDDAALAAFEGCKIESDNQELKKLLNKCVELGRQDHQKKLAAGKA